MTKHLKIALAQLNPTVGDLEGNIAKAQRALDQARELGADLVVLPELFVAGYPPEDLILKPAFVDAAKRAIESLARSVTSDGRTFGQIPSPDVPKAARGADKGGSRRHS